MTAPGPDTPPALAALDLGALVEGPLSQARARIEAAGGRLRAVPRNEPVTLDYRADRVTLIVENDVVVSVVGIG
ncbi:MAG: hypothetical protein JWO63_3070 [Frankiales bacterium]|jgi:hypothetical protein|nr:hypothetical protein [Frankiales bacterium]